MDRPDNPFVIQGYFGKHYFCDRKSETKFIRDSLKNGVNVVLISPRRIGKSSLIHHVFQGFSGKKIFVDLWAVSDMEELVTKLANAIFTQYKKPSPSLFKSIGAAFKSLQFSMGLNSISGAPEFSFEINPKHGPLPALGELFAFLKNEKHRFYIALDEFQQIALLAESNAEAILREHIQQCKNIHFIFSGSHRGMMTVMFSNPKRPFFQSASPLHLTKIPSKAYVPFIKNHFGAAGKSIDDELIDELIDWCRQHTYYIQYFCNRLFALGTKKYTVGDIEHIKMAILKERAPEYGVIQNILGRQHWNLLIALACEEPANQITSGTFLKKYNLSAASTVSQNLKSLVEKQMIEFEEEGYILSDVFFSRWLRYIHSQ